MTIEEYIRTVDGMIELISYTVNGEPVRKESAEKLDLDSLLTVSVSQSLSAITAYALEKAGITDPRFKEKKSKAKRASVLFDMTRRQISDQLEQRGIWHLPLKGAVIKDFYPAYGLREMSDNDILCDGERMADVREVMEGLGFSCEEYGHPVRDVYYRDSLLSFEMHRRLFSSEWEIQKDFSDYYDRIKDKLIRDDGKKYTCHLSDEDFYLFILSHEYKHYQYGGTGLRSLLDIYVFLQKKGASLDEKYLREELEKLCLTEFEQLNRSLSQKLFTRQKLSEEEQGQLNYFINSGTYGNVSYLLINQADRALKEDDTRSAKLRYLRKRVFISGDYLEANYPFFYRHKYLLPALYIYRPIKGLVKHPKAIARELRGIRKYKK